MKRLKYVIFFTAFVAAKSLAAQTGSDQAVQLYQEALKLSDLAQKEAKLKEAIAVDAKLIEAHIALGNVYLTNKTSNLAIGAFSNAIGVDAQSEQAFLGLGLAHRLAGQNAEAKGAFEYITKLKPDFAPAHFELGVTLIALKSYPEAEKALQQAVLLNPEGGSAFSQLGLLYFQQGKRAESKAAFQSALKNNPNDRVAADYLGRINRDENIADLIGKARRSLAQKRLQEARRFVADALAADGGNREARRLKTQIDREISNSQKQPVERPKASEAKKKEAVDAPNHYAKGLEHLSQEKWPQAREAFLEAAKESPENKENMARLAYVQGRLHLQKSEWTLAEARFSDAQENDPDFADASLFLAYAKGRDRLENEAWDEARVAFNVALTYKSDFPQAEAGLLSAEGWIAFQAGDAPGAKRKFENAVRLDAGFEAARKGLAEVADNASESGSGFDEVRPYLMIAIGFSAVLVIYFTFFRRKPKPAAVPVQGYGSSEPTVTEYRSGSTGSGGWSASSFTEDEAPTQLIRTINDRYRLDQELGRGGMGVVYRAWDLKMKRAVALKTIRFDSTMPEQTLQEIKERFRREAVSAGALSPEHIVIIYDVDEDWQSNTIFISMEFLQGEDLKHRMRRVKNYSPKDAADIVRQVCLALEETHNNGIVHRDIKPSNIWLQRNNRVKLLDFGVAKVTTSTMMTSSTLTTAGFNPGTVEYMSPEQADAKELDGRSDLFSLGTVFYELLTGVKPFKGEGISSTFSKIFNYSPPDPSQLNDTIPKPMELVVTKMLEKDRDQRYQKAREIIADLDKLQF